MILVTGGTGFIGRRLVTALTDSRLDTRVLTRTAAPGGFPAGVDIRLGDLLEPGSLDEALDGAQAIVHLGGAVSGDHLAHQMFRANVEGTRNLAMAARARGVSAIVHCSSAGVYGNGTAERPHAETAPPAPLSAYERSKLEGERALVGALADSPVRWTILRPTGVHGPGRAATLDFYRTVQRQRFWLQGPARVLVHPTYVDDVVQAIRLVLDRTDLAGETFNIAGARALPYPALVETVARSLGARVSTIAPFPRAIRTGARLAQQACALAGAPSPRVLARLATPIVNRAVDTAKARDRLGFAPVALDAGIQETVRWFRQRGLL